ncbi:MAG: hypothetical protein ABIB71_00740 [Candidatus Woesearchaeota archaeon]
MNTELIAKLADMEDTIVPTLFKPAQFRIIKKLKNGKRLTENEKRYLRGNMRKKIEAIEKITIREREGYMAFLSSLGSYYITGLEALKHNGYGWYFDTKVIEVINTKLEGKLKVKDKTFRLIRARSATSAACSTDRETGLRYATNEQVLKDTRITKNDYTRAVWMQLLSRYRKLFVRNLDKYKHLIKEPIRADYSRYGV